MINPALLRLGQLMGVIMFVAHFLSCFWAAVNSCDYKYQYDEDELEDVLFTGFKYNLNYDPFGEVIPGTLISKCGNENSYHLWVSQYLAAFYWVIATMMAVGYGDIYGTTNAERTYAIFVEIVGAGCFGFIISTVTHIVETMSPESRIRKHEMEVSDKSNNRSGGPRRTTCALSHLFASRVSSCVARVWPLAYPLAAHSGVLQVPQPAALAAPATHEALRVHVPGEVGL